MTEHIKVIGERKAKDLTDDYMRGCIAIDDDASEGGLIAIDFKPPHGFSSTALTTSDIKGDVNLRAAAGRYYIMPVEGITNSNGEVGGIAAELASYRLWGMKFNPYNAILIAADKDTLKADDKDGDRVKWYPMRPVVDPTDCWRRKWYPTSAEAEADDGGAETIGFAPAFNEESADQPGQRWFIGFQSLINGIEQQIARTGKRNRSAGVPLENRGMTLTTTLVESVIHGTTKRHAPLSAEDYDERIIPIEQGSNSTDTTLLQLMNEDIESGKEAVIDAADRPYVDALHSIISDNPDVWTVRGSDILKRCGKTDPLRRTEDAAAAMDEAYRAITKYLTTWIAIDTTKTKPGRQRAKNYKAITLRPIIRGDIEAEQWEDSDGEVIRDFVVYLATTEGSRDPRESLALLDYATAAKEVVTVGTDAYPPRLGKNQRRICNAIFRQAQSKGLKHPDTFTWDTLIMQAGVPDGNDGRKAAKKTVRKITDYLIGHGYLESLEMTSKGFRLIGVDLPKRNMEIGESEQKS